MSERKTCKEHPERAAAGFCVKCGAPVCELCVIEVLDRPHCPVCGSVRKAEIKKEKKAPKIAVQTPDFKLAVDRLRAAGSRFGGAIKNKELKRLIAFAADMFFVFLMSIPVSFLFQPLEMLLGMPEAAGFMFFLNLYFSLTLVGSVYFVYMVWRHGGGWGKKLFGLRVEKHGGGRLGLIASAWRMVGMMTAAVWAVFGFWLGGWLFRIAKLGVDRLPAPVLMLLWALGLASALFFSLGVAITFVGKRKRGFHDILAGSIVVSE